jgi:hypothetical protein
MSVRAWNPTAGVPGAAAATAGGSRSGGARAEGSEVDIARVMVGGRGTAVAAREGGTAGGAQDSGRWRPLRFGKDAYWERWNTDRDGETRRIDKLLDACFRDVFVFLQI